MYKICLQAGHKGVTTGQTGTAGEQELNWRVTLKLSEILIKKGFQLFIVDANPPDSQINQDFDFFFAIHGDWDSPQVGGGCITAPDPNYDDNNTESKRIVEFIKKSYFSPYTEDTGIVDRPGKITTDMTRYYMWLRLTAKTPCGLIELGEVMDAHDKVILANTDRVANAIAKGICKAFNVAWEVPPITPPTPVTNWEQKYNDLNKTFSDYKSVFNQITQNNAVANAEKVLQDKINKAKQDLS
jgi:N-acetylmuramoyl-L-alanine amidase